MPCEIETIVQNIRELMPHFKYFKCSWISRSVYYEAHSIGQLGMASGFAGLCTGG